ncbi:MAG TPA: hypothetical protein VFF32_05720 [Dermatophilaceae bacterium]|nr:hypothetical protein [Dermatophilaceae bacterium]
MYVIRRVWVVMPRQARKAASLALAAAAEYERAGQRSDVRVTYNGGTLPGERDRVYMEWMTDSIQSPHRADNAIPERARELQAKLREVTSDSWIEFAELMTPEKAVPIDG